MVAGQTLYSLPDSAKEAILARAEPIVRKWLADAGLHTASSDGLVELSGVNDGTAALKVSGLQPADGSTTYMEIRVAHSGGGPILSVFRMVEGVNGGVSAKRLDVAARTARKPAESAGRTGSWYDVGRS